MQTEDIKRNNLAIVLLCQQNLRLAILKCYLHVYLQSLAALSGFSELDIKCFSIRNTTVFQLSFNFTDILSFDTAKETHFTPHVILKHFRVTSCMCVCISKVLYITHVCIFIIVY